MDIFQRLNLNPFWHRWGFWTSKFSEPSSGNVWEASPSTLGSSNHTYYYKKAHKLKEQAASLLPWQNTKSLVSKASWQNIEVEKEERGVLCDIREL